MRDLGFKSKIDSTVHAEVREENNRLQKTEAFIHSPIHHALSTHALRLLEVTGCMLRIQREISHDPSVREKSVMIPLFESSHQAWKTCCRLVGGLGRMERTQKGRGVL